MAGGSPTDLEKAKMIKAWILHPEQRQELFWDYASVFLTQDREMRKRLTTKATAAAQEAMEQEAQRLMDGIEAISTMNVARGMRGWLLRHAMNQVTPASIKASTMPGTIPAMNKAPIEVLVETPYSTRMIDGGTRMPRAPDVEITPTPKRDGKP